MTRIVKLYAHLLASQKISISFREFEQLLRAFGFTLDRQRGSHRTYTHPDCTRPLVIQPKNGDAAAPYQVRAFIAMIEEFHLSLDA
jgi:predicted RNA binding protein YcfA (HicA-like mRNA interferase family)